MGTSRTARSPLSLLGTVLRATIALVLFSTFAGCGEQVQTSEADLTNTSSHATTASTYEVVQFTTQDGLTLDGRLYGASSRAVLLCHMYPADQNSWTTQAEQLADQGYLALTFDFRGYGSSQGSKDIQYLDRDVTAAVQYLRTAGAQEVVLVGASMGGTACLKAAAELQLLSSIRVAGVAALSAPVEFRGLAADAAVSDLQMAMLFVAAERDSGADAARTLQSLSGDRGELHILPGGDHGTDLFNGQNAAEVWQLLLDFVRLCMPAGG